MIKNKFSLKDGSILNINSSQLKYFKNLSVNITTREQGGIVIGKKLMKDDIYTVIDFYHAKNISSKENRYLCDAKEVNKYIYRQWKKSSGINNYIGEWHTHYEDYPTPSKVDKMMMENIIVRDSAPRKIFLFILGKKQIYIGTICKEKNTLDKIGDIRI